MSGWAHDRSGARVRVLIIDDAELLLRSFKRVLARDYDVTGMASASEALRRIAEGERWDVILCDLHMPDLDGQEFHERLGRSTPSLVSRVAFMTGGTFTPRLASFMLRTSAPTLRKPMTSDDLRTLIEAMARPREEPRDAPEPTARPALHEQRATR